MKKFLLLICCIFLSACATMPAKQGPINQEMSWQTRQQQVTPIQNWHLEGAVAIKTPQHGQSASMTWQESKRNYTINLFGPLGMGRISLSGRPKQVTLLAQNKEYHAATPEILMQNILGWHLPVENLYYWVRGLPAPSIPAKLQFDAYHHLTQLQQQQWHITYLQYTAVGRVDLPSKLLLQHGNLQVKIIISSWGLSQQ